MVEIGGFAFPEQGDQAACEAWRPTIRVTALACRVLVVAKTRIEGRWNAYCDAVPGINHDDEWEEVKHHGCKLPEHIAEAIFPEFKNIPYAP